MKLFEFLAEFYEKIKLKELQKLANKVVFITGANGLVGGNLLSYLHFLNKKQGLKMKLIAHSFSPPLKWLPDGIEYLSGDLCEFKPSFHFDFLIHAATYGQPKKVFEYQNATVRLNTTAYIELLEQAKLCKATVLFLSTSSIYGEIPFEKSPAKEDFVGSVNCTNFASLYAESKRMAECISSIYATNGLDLRVARLAIAYGAGVKIDDKRFINEFIKKALQGELTMMDSGAAVRQVCFISDAIEMLLNVMLSAKDRVYNVSGLFDEKVGTVSSIAKIIAKHTQSKLVFPKEEKGVVGAYNSVVIDIGKYCKEFDKKDFVSLETGLKKNIEWIEFLKGV